MYLSTHHDPKSSSVQQGVSMARGKQFLERSKFLSHGLHSVCEIGVNGYIVPLILEIRQVPGASEKFISIAIMEQTSDDRAGAPGGGCGPSIRCARFTMNTVVRCLPNAACISST